MRELEREREIARREVSQRLEAGLWEQEGRMWGVKLSPDDQVYTSTFEEVNSHSILTRLSGRVYRSTWNSPSRKPGQAVSDTFLIA